MIIIKNQKRNEEDPSLNNNQYNQINNFLQELNLKEEQEIDERKPYLYMNQGTRQYELRR